MYTIGGVILTRDARKKRKETGDPRYRARIEDERPSMRELVWVSCTRPLVLLTTEPVVTSFSVRFPLSRFTFCFDSVIFWVQTWIGFAWGVLYVLIQYVLACHYSPEDDI